MIKTIYLAGGCFWGVQEYYSRLLGVLSVVAGYANGNSDKPTYEQVKSQKTGHAETVKVVFDDSVISLEKLLEHFLRFVNPYSLNKQGEDEGIQYRSGVYYTDDEYQTIKEYFDSHLKDDYKIELLKLTNFYPAEDYHQDYLKKNPGGYCHINLSLIKNNERK